MTDATPNVTATTNVTATLNADTDSDSNAVTASTGSSTIDTGGIAAKLAGLYSLVTGAPLPLGLRAWDGSHAGPADPPLILLRSRSALRRLLWHPNELGLAQAYVTGELDLDGDLSAALRRFKPEVSTPGGESARTPASARPRLTPGALGKALLTVARLGALGPRPAAPATQAQLRGRLHTRSRDRAAIAHHYDLSNDFYELILDASMAYSCAYWTSTEPGYTLDDAQRDKLDLICRKLDLGPGRRLLDVGCGWGALLLHAAEHYGVRGLGVTLSAQQEQFVRERIEKAGLSDRVRVRLVHYRDLEASGDFDAVCTIEMGEHVGGREYPAFARRLHDLLAPGGRLLVQQMSRGAVAPGGGAFIERFIAPDMHMRPLGETVGLLERAGVEVTGVEALREHYALTVRAWAERLEARWEEVVRMVGLETARVWRLYLAGGALAFEQGRMGVDQILAVKPSSIGESGMPTSPKAWLA